MKRIARAGPTGILRYETAVGAIENTGPPRTMHAEEDLLVDREQPSVRDARSQPQGHSSLVPLGRACHLVEWKREFRSEFRKRDVVYGQFSRSRRAIRFRSLGETPENANTRFVRLRLL